MTKLFKTLGIGFAIILLSLGVASLKIERCLSGNVLADEIKSKVTVLENIEEQNVKASAEADFTIDKNGVILEYNGTDTEVVIPSSISSITPLSIGRYAFYRNTKITSVELPEEITTIEQGAFDGCKSLTSIDLSKITAIGDRAFYGCEGLTEVDITMVTSLGDYAFSRCANLDGLKIDGTGNMFNNDLTELPDYCFYDTMLSRPINLNNITLLGKYTFGYTLMTSIDISNITSLGNYAFAENSVLSDIDANNDGIFNPALSVIPDYCFTECWSLTGNIDLNNVLEIGEGAFSLSGIISTDLSNIISMGSEAFAECEELLSIDSKKDGTFSDALLIIPYNCFWKSYKLTGDIDFNNVTNIGGDAFYKTSITSVKLSNVTTINYSAFYECYSLNQIVADSSGKMFNSGLKTIPHRCFYKCTSLQGAIDLNNVTNIEDQAFTRTGITEIDLSKVSGYILEEAFYECDKLTTIDSKLDGTFNAKLKAIPDYCFYECQSLTGSIDFNNIETIGGGAFYNTKITSIDVSSVKEFIFDKYYGTFENCGLLANIDANSDGVFNDALTDIPYACFYHCQLSGDISLNNIVTVGDWAFTGNQFAKLEAPKIQTVGQQAFKGSKNIYLGKAFDYTLGKAIEENGAIIYGYVGTKAEDYCEQEGNTFESLKTVAITNPLKKTHEGLVVEAEGYGISYQWYVGTTSNLTPDTATRISGATSNVLNTFDYSAGTFYLVEVTDWIGESVTTASTVQMFTFKVTINYDETKGIVECVQSLSAVDYGTNRTLYITPVDGFNVAKVTLNGEEVRISNGQLVISNITFDQEVNVEFVGEEDEGSAVMLYIIIGLIAGTLIIFILLWKFAFKRRTFEY